MVYFTLNSHLGVIDKNLSFIKVYGEENIIVNFTYHTLVNAFLGNMLEG
jgi:hypothetical protein